MDTVYFAGAKMLLDHFLKGGHIGDGDKEDLTHVSADEFKAARGVSMEGDAFIDFVLQDEDNYELVSSLQSEGIFNDGEVSLRDLYALISGRGYEGEDLSEPLAALERAAIARPSAKHRDLMALYIVNKGFETSSKTEYTMTIEMSRERWSMGLTYDGKPTSKKVTDTLYRKISVKAAEFKKYSAGDSVPDDFVAKYAPEFNEHAVTVTNKTRSDFFFYKDAGGKLVEISKDVFKRVDQVKKSSYPVVERS